ncbi:MAG: hypothetical protein AAFV88_11490, partial [Planctomycetota bacterium]
MFRNSSSNRSSISCTQSRPKKRSGRRARQLLFQSLSKRELMAADLSLVDQGFEGDHLAQLQQQVNSQILQTPAPLVGDALASSEVVTSDFLRDVGTQLRDIDFGEQTQVKVEHVREQLSSVLGVSAEAITVTGIDGDSQIEFLVELSGVQNDARVDLDLNGADPEITLELGGEDTVDLDVDWSYELRFGVRELDGVSEFYINEATDEVSINYNASILDQFQGDESGKGRVGVFLAELSKAEESTFNGSYTIDVGGEADAPVVSGSLTGSGDVSLEIDAAFFPSFASTDSDLVNFGVTAVGEIGFDTELNFAEDGTVDASGNVVTVGMQDVTLDMGTLYTDFVDPLIGDLQERLRPVKPVVDFLMAPVPVASHQSKDRQSRCTAFPCR